MVIRVDGELDVLTAPKLAGRLNSILLEHAANVVLDLRRVEFIDSAGLHVLLNAHRRLTHASRTLSVVCNGGPVRRVIELARLVDTLGVVATLDEQGETSLTSAGSVPGDSPVNTAG